MGRMSKQAKATKQLLEMVTASLDDLGLSEVDTKSLMAAATSLAIKVGDKAESDLLEAVMVELSGRSLDELGASALLSSAAFLVTNGGERPDEKTLSKTELAGQPKITNQTINKKRRC